MFGNKFAIPDAKLGVAQSVPLQSYYDSREIRTIFLRLYTTKYWNFLCFVLKNDELSGLPEISVELRFEKNWYFLRNHENVTET